MLNHRLIDPPKEPEQFVASAVKFLRKYAQDKKVFCALSGGIDSSATYLLLKEANIDTLPVFIDHGLMRIIRGVEERKYIKKLFPDVKIIDIREDFLPKIYGEGDAERKRQLFKDAYSDVISRVIKEENCDLLADGTILPDIEESFGVKIRDLKETISLEEEQALMEQNKEGFVKSQHNLNIRYEVDATLQPVASLTKDEVREILKHFDMPSELVFRKAFPGPALAARIIGPVTAENLAFEKKVHDIVEKSVENHYEKRYGKFMIINKNREQEPFQAFAAISENILETKVTGLIDGKRSYEYPLLVKAKWDFNRLVETASDLKNYSRLLYELGRNQVGEFDVIIRSVNSIDARNASVTEFSLEFLTELSKELLKDNKTRCVYYDITSKPPATIEYV
ncbi:MAG: GMP synthase [Promethearchaeota archaeon]|nr:MAG: GMP synthase [Candidatus Lokiarchaeota archaeon]